MGEKDGIELWKLFDRDTWRRDPRKKSTQRLFKIRIRQDARACYLQKQCRMTDIGNPQTPSRVRSRQCYVRRFSNCRLAVTGACLPRSRASSHC